MSDQITNKLEKDIAVILERVSVIPEMRAEIKEMGNQIDELHLKYAQMNSSLVAFTDIKKMIDKAKEQAEKEIDKIKKNHKEEREKDMERVVTLEKRFQYFAGGTAVMVILAQIFL